MYRVIFELDRLLDHNHLGSSDSKVIVEHARLECEHVHKVKVGTAIATVTPRR